MVERGTPVHRRFVASSCLHSARQRAPHPGSPLRLRERLQSIHTHENRNSIAVAPRLQHRSPPPIGSNKTRDRTERLRRMLHRKWTTTLRQLKGGRNGRFDGELPPRGGF